MRIQQEEAILGRLLGMVGRRVKIVPNPFSKEVLKSKCFESLHNFVIFNIQMFL